MSVHTVLFDLAGTTIDCGCLAPVGVFVEVFRRHGVTVDITTARGPMGTHKREHIRRVCELPSVRAQWGGVPSEADIDALYAEAEPLQIAVLPQHAELIPGVEEVLHTVRARGLKIGATTGYTRPMVDVLAPLIWVPDTLVCASDVPAGRPAPYMNHLAAMRLGAPDVGGCVVVGDTVSDMQAARNAGMWAVGVAMTGNEVGLPWPELTSLPLAERQRRRRFATARLLEAGAHFVIDSVVDLPGVIDGLRRQGHVSFEEPGEPRLPSVP